MDGSKVLKNLSQSDNTPSKNPISCKQTDLCFILGSPSPPIGNQVRHILIILSLLPSFPQRVYKC